MNRLSTVEILAEVGLMIASKQQWLRTFSSGPKKWPDLDIQRKRRELVVLQQIQAAYRELAKRKAA